MLIALNKPYGVLSSFTHESQSASDAGKRTLSEFGLPAGVYAAGRLDYDSEGLLLLSDEGALIHALTTGALRGAAIDVARTEPLPATDPLWDAPNLLISPHSSTSGDGYADRAFDLLCTNLERLLRGEAVAARGDSGIYLLRKMLRRHRAAVAIGAAFAASLVLTLMFLGSIMRPLKDLEDGIRLIREGQYGVTIPVTTPDEFGELSAAFNGMSKGLAEREKIRATFATYMDGGVAHHILTSDTAGAGAEVEVSLLFCDVREFTSFAAKAQAPDVLARLNHLFEAVVPIINGHGGHVNKFVGDGLLAVFGAPEPYADHAERAVRCAIAMAQRVNHGGSGLFSVGIGVNSGRVVAGSIGGAGRLEYSVIGDAVNVAARVEAATRDLDDEVLITEQTRMAIGGTIELVNRGLIELRGKPEPVEVWAPVVQTAERRLPVSPDGAVS